MSVFQGQISHHLNCSHITLLHTISADLQRRHQTNKQTKTKKKHYISKASQAILLLVLFTCLDGPHPYPWCLVSSSHIVLDQSSAIRYGCSLRKHTDLQALWDQCPPNILCKLIQWRDWSVFGCCRNFFVFIWSVMWEPESCGNYSPTCCV